jgi:hypothetical protein
MAKIRGGLRNVRGAITRLTLLSAYEQTRGSWARPIESCDALPAVYKDFFEPLLADGRPFPYTVLTPSYEGFIHRTSEKLISDLGCEICILERKGNTFDARCYPLEGISYAEVRSVLLDSHFKICGVTSQGVPAYYTHRFNTVNDHHFAPFLAKIRPGVTDSRVAPTALKSSDFSDWLSLNYKFMNLARHSLLEGERVIHAILQPEIRAHVLTLLGKTYYRVISPTHATILTDRELIIIREEAWHGGKERYGGIWDYIPLNKIVALSLSENDLLKLSIQLPAGERLECLFRASAKSEVEQLRSGLPRAPDDNQVWQQVVTHHQRTMITGETRCRIC